MTYRIKSWSTLYENNRTRELKRLDWLPLPNRHDGEKYARLMLRADGPTIFAAWILLLQVASRCGIRGTLSRDDGTPLDCESFAIRTRASKTLFEKSLPVLLQMGWIETVEADATQVNQDDSATGRDITAPPCDMVATRCLEGKGREEKRMEEKRNNARGAVLPFQEPGFVSAWESWLQHLKQKKKPPTANAIAQQLNKLHDIGLERAIAALRHSIAGNYQGIYEPNPHQNGQGKLRLELPKITTREEA